MREQSSRRFIDVRFAKGRAAARPGLPASPGVDVCDLYLSETRTESQTIRTDRSACRRICSTVLPGGKVVGEVPLSKLDWKTVEAVYAAWEGALDPMTSSRYASTMSKVLEHTKRTGWITANPCADARRPKVPSHRPTVPSFGDVREALDRAKAVDFMLHA